MCPRNRSGGLAVTFLEGAQGLLSRFARVYDPVFRLHHSRGRRGCSGGLVVASLEETEGLLSRFDSCVFRLYHCRGPLGAQGVLWWVAMSLPPRCFFFPTHDEKTRHNWQQQNREPFVLHRSILLSTHVWSITALPSPRRNVARGASQNSKTQKSGTQHPSSPPPLPQSRAYLHTSERFGPQENRI